LHGEAVAIGMVMATDFSERSNLLGQGARLRLEQLLEGLGLPTALREPLSAGKMLQAMGMDKKTTDGQLRLVVADAIGNARITGDFDANLLKAVLSEYCE
ncbi:MAG: 3-dehydroquinate synthase, partial [Gammaproteobacteria bacterium]|nr:3-dehydroquinate synthase [Gammaproteobacteria bacterium]